MRASLFSKLADQGASILIQVEETSRRLNQLLAPENQKTLFAAVHDIGQAAASLRQFAGGASRILEFQFGPEQMNLPQLADNMDATLKSLQATSHSVGASIDEFKGAAVELRQLAKSVAQPGGALDKLGQGTDALTRVGESFGANTLPRLNRASDETTRTARALGQAAAALNDNPQALVYGNGALPPGPGEAGFQTPAAKGTP
jgi:phospholipid/cholesterol/gamma-HCH transport system substrate-binding protein